MTTRAERSVQVDGPVSTADDQWTQFEDFPAFTGGGREVRRLDDRRLHWVAEIAGVRRGWEASILEQVPDQKVAWAATAGATNAGAVRFEPAGPGSTTVPLPLEYEPEGLVEQVGDTLGIVERQVTSDLERFGALVEDQGYATGVARAAMSEGDSGQAGSPARPSPPAWSRSPPRRDPPVDPLEPVADDPVLADLPETTTGKEHLQQDDEGRPGPAV